MIRIEVLYKLKIRFVVFIITILYKLIFNFWDRFLRSIKIILNSFVLVSIFKIPIFFNKYYIRQLILKLNEKEKFIESKAIKAK